MSATTRFFLYAFAGAWAIWLPMALGAQGVLPLRLPPLLNWLGGVTPALAALLVVRRSAAGEGVGPFLWRIHGARLRPGPVLVALLLPFAVVAAVTGLDLALGGEPALPTPRWGMLGVLTVVMLVLAWGEEVGWRAWALPRLVARYGVVASSLGLGLVWGLWHLPKFWLATPPLAPEAILAFLLQITAASFVFTWLVLASGGGVLPALLYHATFNITAILFPTIATEWAAVAVAWVVALPVVAWSRNRRQAADVPMYTEAPGDVAPTLTGA